MTERSCGFDSRRGHDLNKLTDAIPASASLPSRRRRRILLRAGIILLILLGIGEMVSRFVLGLGDPPLYVADNEIQYYNLPARTYHRFGNTIAINAFSMRSPDFPAHKNDPREL